jgi:hypothetical protein
MRIKPVSNSLSLMRWLWAGSLYWLLSPCAFAAITVHSVSGVSNWVKEGGSIIVYGGFAGSESTGCTANSDGTCNNCILGTGLLACNEKRAMLNSDVEISISSSSASKSGPIILTSGDGITKIGSSGTTVGKDETGVVKIPWTTICASAFSAYAASACVNSASASNASPPSQTLKIGVDEDSNGQLGSGEGDSIIFKVHMPLSADTIEHCSDTGATFTDGVCAFTAFPGDEKVFIEDLEPTETFPNAGNIQFSKARFYYSTVGFTYGATGPNPGSNFGSFDIDIETENDEYFLGNNSISGLTNGEYYFFRIGMLDQANNISFITSDTAIAHACGNTAAALGPNPTDDAACPFIARPDEVVGLLTEDVNCFVATAAYGSSLDRHLDTFRKFRQKFLLPYKLGKDFVRTYYRLGPFAARWIDKHPFWRPFVRTILWPVWGFAWLSIKYGLSSALTFLLFLFFASLTLIFYNSRRRNKNERLA